MLENAYLLFGLGAAMLYAVAASCLKAAGLRGAGSLQTTVLANLALAAVFLAFLPWGEETLAPAVWWPCFVEGGLLFVGQLTTVLAISRGCPSISTPVLGSKVMWVAFVVAVALRQPVSGAVWLAAALIAAGITLLAFSTGEMHRAGRVATFGYALLAAVSFAVFDVMTQYWSPILTFGRFMPWALLIGAGMTVMLLPLKERAWPKLPLKSLPWALGGAVVLAVQSLLLIWAIGAFKDATRLNVVYGSRGIWAVLLVWLIGTITHSHKKASHADFARRLVAAVLIASAVALALVSKPPAAKASDASSQPSRAE